MMINPYCIKMVVPKHHTSQLKRIEHSFHLFANNHGSVEHGQFWRQSTEPWLWEDKIIPIMVQEFLLPPASRKNQFFEIVLFIKSCQTFSSISISSQLPEFLIRPKRLASLASCFCCSHLRSPGSVTFPTRRFEHCKSHWIIPKPSSR